MIRKIIRKLRTWAKEVAAALKPYFRSAAPDSLPSVPFGRMVEALVGLEHVLNASTTGKLIRKPKDHSPVFSLYTFFGNRS